MRILRMIGLICLAAALMLTAGCQLPEWDCGPVEWHDSYEPFVGSDGLPHEPSDGNVWRYVNLALVQRRAAAVALDLADVSLVVGDVSYAPSALLPHDVAFPATLYYGIMASGLLVFDTPSAGDGSGGLVVLYPPDGSVIGVALNPGGRGLSNRP